MWHSSSGLLMMSASIAFSIVLKRSRVFSHIQRRALAEERKKSSIYTRTGDKGTSSLYNGERRGKDDPTFDALGNQDELNAVIGIAREHCSQAQYTALSSMLEVIQCRLFDLGASIATPPTNSSEDKLAYVKFSTKFTGDLERWIDEIDVKLPPLKNFVIPSGGFCSLYLNHARTVCRRTERSVVTLVSNGQVDPEVGRYLNRLSDFLFVASRQAALLSQVPEIKWTKATSEGDRTDIE